MENIKKQIDALEQRIVALEPILDASSKIPEYAINSALSAIPFDYSETEEGICIDRYTGFDEQHIEIPAYIDQKPVITLAPRSFYFDFIKTVKLPETLKSIQDGVFLYPCRMGRFVLPEPINGIYGQTTPETEYLDVGIHRINIPASVEEIGEHAFAGHSAGLLKNTIIFYCHPGTYGIRYAREHGFTIRPYADFETDVFDDDLQDYMQKKHRKIRNAE